METKKAGTLELQAVNQQALLDIILDIGGIEALTTQQYSDMGKALNGSNRMLTYCLGWGVVNDPPPDAIETLDALGKPTHIKELARANWLRYLALDNEESAELIAEVVKLTFGG